MTPPGLRVTTPPMSSKRMIVTGGSGKVGHWVARHPLEEGYDVVNIDARLPRQAQGGRHLTTGSGGLGQ